MKTADIISGLETIANKYKVLATVWHLLFYGLLISLLAKWQPSNSLFGILLCLPLLSVALLAWINGNPFNGTMFSVLSLLLVIFAIRLSPQVVSTSQLIFMIIGICMIAYGLVYPHFLETDSIMKYFYASPAGLVPCPTLSVLIGILLVFNGLGSPSIQMLLVIFGLFYGLFGAIKLKVYLDIGLITGSIILLIKFFMNYSI